MALPGGPPHLFHNPFICSCQCGAFVQFIRSSSSSSINHSVIRCPSINRHFPLPSTTLRPNHFAQVNHDDTCFFFLCFLLIGDVCLFFCLFCLIVCLSVLSVCLSVCFFFFCFFFFFFFFLFFVCAKFCDSFTKSSLEVHRTIARQMTVYATMSKSGRIPSGVHNLGVQTAEAYSQLLDRAKVSLKRCPTVCWSM